MFHRIFNLDFYQPMRFMKFDTVAGDTDIIFAIRYFVNPASNQCLTFFVFRDSFNFLDCAAKGRPNLLPVARILSRYAFVRCDIKLRSGSEYSHVLSILSNTWRVFVLCRPLFYRCLKYLYKYPELYLVYKMLHNHHPRTN